MVLAGCCDIINPTTCDQPYIKSGSECCLDANGNDMCDSDEYLCADGTVAASAGDCPQPMVRCPDGTMVYSAADCPAPRRLDEPGYYVCNTNNASEPCDTYVQYCERFTPADLAVRSAAAQAIAGHPGPFSVNQIMDVYDWVNRNVFYQNVPLDMSMPYPPNETLQTKSGDCKNQAVLVASMIEAIGGSAEVLIVPDCSHAFPLVYLGNGSNKDVFFKAVRSHYGDASNATLHFYHHTENNETVYWVLADTAGAYYPGDTIEGCLNGTQTFEIDPCSGPEEEPNPPATARVEYGPWTLVQETKIINPGWTHYREMSGLWDSAHRFCMYNVTLRSESGFMDWFVTDREGYQGYKDGQAFSYNYGGEGVMNGAGDVYRDTKDSVYLIIHNPNKNIPVTVDISVVVRCYGP